MNTKSRLMKGLFGAGTVALLVTGCMLTRSTVVTPNPTGGFTTNVVVTVNEANLALDAAAFQSVTTIGASLAIQQDHTLVGPLKTAQQALDGILYGASTNSVQQVLTLLKAQNNPVLSQQVTALVSAASQLEQNLLMKYGTGVASEIGLALAKAADAGLIVALQGH